MTTLAGFGARVRRIGNSAAIGGATTLYRIKKGYTSAIGYGDFVFSHTTTYQGYIVPYAEGGARILGVFNGLMPYYDTVLGAPIGGKLWYAGTESPSDDLWAEVYDDPDTIFTMQVSGGPVTKADTGKSIDIVANGTPNTLSGISTGAADYTSISSSTATYPLRIEGISQMAMFGINPVNVNTYNSPASNNIIDVRMNTSEWRSSTPT